MKSIGLVPSGTEFKFSTNGNTFRKLFNATDHNNLNQGEAFYLNQQIWQVYSQLNLEQQVYTLEKVTRTTQEWV